MTKVYVLLEIDSHTVKIIDPREDDIRYQSIDEWGREDDKSREDSGFRADNRRRAVQHYLKDGFEPFCTPHFEKVFGEIYYLRKLVDFE